MREVRKKVCVIGAGPAGLTAAFKLVSDFDVVVLEANPRYVGGISRTEEFRGYRVDIGGHRFFSKSEEVNQLWREFLPRDFLQRSRLSRILYRKKFFSYPLRPLEVFLKLGVVDSVLSFLSLLASRLRSNPKIVSFEDWIVREFGEKIYRTFFKTYTEKVWGIPCSEISADWAAQRIKGVTLTSLLKSSFSKSNDVKSLITKFFYPRLGPGMMWEAAAQKFEERGGELVLGATVTGLKTLPSERWLVEYNGTSREVDFVISSAPLRNLVLNYLNEPNFAVRNLAERLKYRDFIVVALVIRPELNLQDNWLYIHDPNVSVGRIQNFKAWSPDMVPVKNSTCLGLEYFCNQGDKLWALSDEAFVTLAKKEIDVLGIASRDQVVDAFVIRQNGAYPVYDTAYQDYLGQILTFLEERYPTLQTIGRNGLHKYNNQDHSMMTGILAAKNILGNDREFDLRRVNIEAEYLESSSGERMFPASL